MRLQKRLHFLLYPSRATCLTGLFEDGFTEFRGFFLRFFSCYAPLCVSLVVIMNGIISGNTITPTNIVPLPTPPQRRGGKALHITKRNGIWYFKILCNGQRLFRSLTTTDKTVALARARAMTAKARAAKWQDIDGVRARRSLCTCGEVFAALAGGAVGLGLAAHSVAGYCNQLRNILRQVLKVEDADSVCTEKLTEELILSYQDLVLNATPAHLRERAQRTIRSTVTNARAVFGRRTERLYRHLALPDLKGFRTCTLNRALVKAYALPPVELIERTLQEGRGLREKDPALYACFLLCYELGLRSGEAAAARWSWFAAPRQAGGDWTIEILRRPEFTPKWNMERRVPVGAEVWEYLQGLKTGHRLTQIDTDGEFVLPGGDRAELVQRRFAAWMRSLGWDRETYPKAAHELRKLMGSRWFTELGAEVAQAWLGHRSVATTCSYYAALRRQPRALEMERLKVEG